MAEKNSTIKRFQTRTFDDFPYTHDETKIVAMRKPAPIFLRFGHFQSETGERSMNWHTGEYERGISVYPAFLVGGMVRPISEWMDDIHGAWDSLKDRTRYVLTGRVVGEGSDGEPLLALSTIVIRGVESPHLIYGLPIVDLRVK